MIPVAVLPAAAILMGLGYWIDPVGWGSNNILAALLIKSGGAIIGHMPILFAIGVAFGMSKDKSGNAALTGLVGFLVVTTLLSKDGAALLLGTDSVSPAFGNIDNQFIGILVGVIAAELYNRYSTVQLPKALSFFSGKRIVPIIMSFVMIAVSFVLLYVWPLVFGVLVSFGEYIQGMGSVGAGIFGFANRMLIPLGLHHALNSVFWFDVAGINDIPNFLAGASGDGVAGITGRYQAGFFPIMMFGLVGAALAFIKTARPEKREGVKAIMVAAAFASFFTGVTEPLEFAFMFVAPVLYVLHAILTGLSLYIAAEFGWMSGFGFSAGLVDLVLSARNPLAVNWYMLLVQGVGFFAVYYFGFTFVIKRFNIATPGREKGSASDARPVLLDTDTVDLASNILEALGGKSNIQRVEHCVTRLRLELVDTDLIDSEILESHVAGSLVIDKNNMQLIIGLNVESIAEVFQAELGHIEDQGGSIDASTHDGKAQLIIKALGGPDNIVNIDNCITRLRLEIKDTDNIDKETLNSLSSGVIVAGKNALQVVLGTEVEFVADAMKARV